MGKIVFWIVVFFVILLGLLPPAEPTVRCEACGVYLPRSEALATDTGFRCGDPACPRRH
jgi:hypothetical protein